MNQPTPPGPGRIQRPTDADLERLGIVWVDERGTTASGLPYPASSDPVANGAANIQQLAEAVTATYRSVVIASLPITSLANVTGNYGLTPIVTVPAATFPRVLRASLDVVMSNAGSFASFYIWRNGAAIASGRGVTPQHTVHVDADGIQLAANTSITLQPIINAGSPTSTYTLGGFTVVAHPA
jgi:hypothetical protein